MDTVLVTAVVVALMTVVATIVGFMGGLAFGQMLSGPKSERRVWGFSSAVAVVLSAALFYCLSLI
jgi:hypothetical protein